MKTLLFIFLLSFSTYAKEAALFAKGGIFLDGHDPVSYLKANKAMKGNKDIAHSYKGSKVYFSSQENKDAFIKDPAKYTPQYNGWCAWAMAKKGELVEVDPESFKVTDGKIYLFYNGLWANTLKKWKKEASRGNEKKLIVDGDNNWKKHK